VWVVICVRVLGNSASATRARHGRHVSESLIFKSLYFLPNIDDSIHKQLIS